MYGVRKDEQTSQAIWVQMFSEAVFFFILCIIVEGLPEGRLVLVQMDLQRFNEKNSRGGISCMTLIHCTASSTHMK